VSWGRIDADKGSWTSVFCAASPEMRIEQSGTYFQRFAEAVAEWHGGMAKNMDLTAKLEERTQEEMKREGWVK
jgi:hypothetical protein